MAETPDALFGACDAVILMLADDAAADQVAERLVQVLDDVVLDVLAAVAGEAEDAVAVADRFEGASEENEALLLEVDDPLRRAG